jgi:8-oxo-dGTP pyrophosphatase MutT (NUDIX family)
MPISRGVWPAEWELLGGRLEPGEAPEECLAREITEEPGCTVIVGPLLDCYRWVALRNS